MRKVYVVLAILVLAAFSLIPISTQKWAILSSAVGQSHSPAIEVSDGIDRRASIQMVYNPHTDELNIVSAILNEVTGHREVWVSSMEKEGKSYIWFTQIGFCRTSTCPVSIAISPKTTQPAIAYRNEDRELVFAELTGTGWQTETVTTTGGNCSLAFDPADNTPAIAYNSIGGDYNLYYSKRYSVGWDQRILSWSDAEFECLRFHPVTGERYISFKTLGWTDHPSNLHLYHDGAPTGYIDGGPNYVGGGNSLAFDQTGYPHITYFDHTTKHVKHAWWDGVEWNKAVIGKNVEDEYGSTSLAIDPDNNIYVSYTKNGQRELYYTYSDGGTWRNLLVATSTNGSISGWSSVVLDNQGEVYIAFVENNEVRVITINPHFIFLPLMLKES